MGITKTAITLIGLRVPTLSLIMTEKTTKNICTCDPQTTEGSFCSECGNNHHRQINKYFIKDPSYFCLDDGNLTSKGYEIVGEWYDNTHIYIAYFVSKTNASYSGEGSDPVVYPLDDHIRSEQAQKMFQAIMRQLGLWNEEEFGLWTVMLLK